jgi:hypothetical protein
MRNLFVSDVAFEFNQAPGTNEVSFWPALGGATVEGNVIHNQTPIQADEAQQKFGQITSSPLGQRLAALFAATRYLPVRDITILKKTRPVIYGLDSGPKVVN